MNAITQLKATLCPEGSAQGVEVRGLAAQRHRRCPVCDFAELREDSVECAGTLWLTECPHCESRWTSRAPRGGVELTHPALSVEPGGRRPLVRSAGRPREGAAAAA